MSESGDAGTDGETGAGAATGDCGSTGDIGFGTKPDMGGSGAPRGFSPPRGARGAREPARRPWATGAGPLGISEFSGSGTLGDANWGVDSPDAPGMSSIGRSLGLCCGDEG